LRLEWEIGNGANFGIAGMDWQQRVNWGQILFCRMLLAQRCQ
jgi:hypothetical protein